MDLFCVHKVIPVLIPYLERSNILTCRQVCKTWKCDVDSYMDANTSHRFFNQKIITKSSRVKQVVKEALNLGQLELESHDFFNIDTLLHFGDMMPPDNTANPFVGRHVSLWCDFEEDNSPSGDDDDFEVVEWDHRWISEQFWNHVSDIFLPCYGEHIWYLTVSPTEKVLFHSIPFNFPRLLRRLLPRVPNLRSLNLKGRPALTLHGVHDPGDECGRQELLRSPLPELPYLESLAFKGMRHFSSYLPQLMLTQYCGQLKRLEVNVPKRLFEQGLKLQNIFPNLLELKLTVDSHQVLSSILQSLKQTNNAHLEILDLNFQFRIEHDQEVMRICEEINAFETSLQVIFFRFRVPMNNLLDMFYEPTAALKTKHLKYLEMTCRLGQGNQGGSEKHASLERKLRHSKMWTRWGNLKAVRFVMSSRGRWNVTELLRESI